MLSQWSQVLGVLELNKATVKPLYNVILFKDYSLFDINLQVADLFPFKFFITEYSLNDTDSKFW